MEKFIGDAVMAVFGVPVVHEDDALRALRAAVEMRDAFPELGIQGRIGVTTGEVVTGTAERLATGDAVNLAARLEQAAQPGEILIGDATLRLTQDAVEVEPVEPLTLKGKAEPVAAHRLLSVHGEHGLRSSPAGADGRARDGDAPAPRRLRPGARRPLVPAVHDPRLGRGGQVPAGCGVPRLARRRPGRAGRCLPYGEGITYWPVVEVLKQLPPAETDPVAAATTRALAAGEELVSSGDEIAWAFRKQLEAVAAETPVVCVFDDVHWGEETFLDLIEHVADLSRDAPILLLCMARPELLDRRTGWAGGKVNATSVLLEPLAPEETGQLIENLAPPRRRPARPDPRRGRGEPALRRGDGRVRARSREAARSPCRRRSRRCSPPVSTSSMRPSGTCSSGARSRGASSTAAPSRRWPPRSSR